MEFLKRLVEAQNELTKEKRALLKEVAAILQVIKRELRVQKGGLYFKKVLFSVKYTGKTGLRLSKIKLTDDNASTWFSFTLPDGKELEEIGPDFIEGRLRFWTIAELQELLDSLFDKNITVENMIVEAKEI